MTTLYTDILKHYIMKQLQKSIQLFNRLILLFNRKSLTVSVCALYWGFTELCSFLYSKGLTQAQTLNQNKHQQNQKTAITELNNYEV